MKAALYTLKLLGQVDFAAAAQENAKWLSLILNAGQPLEFAGDGSHIVCELGDDLSIMKPQIATELEIGAWDSIGSYFEVGLVPQAEQLSEAFRPSFSVTGTLTVPGVAVAHHRQMSDYLLPMAEEAWRLLSSLQQEGGFPLELRIEKSRVVSIRTRDGRELWDEESFGMS